MATRTRQAELAQTPEPLQLSKKERRLFGAAGIVMIIAGLFSLIGQKQNGIATLAVLVAASVFLVIAFVGQIPQTSWTRFSAVATSELQQLRDLRVQIGKDEVMRAIALVASTERVRLEFVAKSQAHVWDAMVTEDGREIGVMYVGPGFPLPDYFSQVIEPGRVESAVLLIFDDKREDADRWQEVQAAARLGGLTLTFVEMAGTAETSTRLSVCGPQFTEIYRHLDTLILDRIGGTGQTTGVSLVSRQPDE